MPRGGLKPGGEKGRPKGSKTKHKLPTKSKMHDAFLNHDFDYLKEWVDLYRKVTPDLKVKMILATTEFIFPRRRPEDGAGQPEESMLETAQGLAKQISEMMSESGRDHK